MDLDILLKKHLDEAKTWIDRDVYTKYTIKAVVYSTDKFDKLERFVFKMLKDNPSIGEVKRQNITVK